MNRLKEPCKGFTIIELLSAIAVIAILASIVISIQRGVFSEQSDAKARGEMQAIATALEAFKQKYRDYPLIDDDPEELYNALMGRTVIGRVGDEYRMVDVPTARAVPLIDEMSIEVYDDGSSTYFLDPWGEPYVYYYREEPNGTWNHTSFILLSSGSDGQLGASITNGNLEDNPSDYYGSPDSSEFDNLVYGY
ncbi:MAG: prepilin-type N-terminal cleavage/methylation domain-containing protein, partial [Verrucomicrobiota bacterium]